MSAVKKCWKCSATSASLARNEETTMKTIKYSLFILLLAVSALDCKKESSTSEPPSGGVLTEQEKQAITQTYQGIAATADTLLLSADPIAGFQRNLALYRGYANVQDAWVDNNALYVAFKKGVQARWSTTPDATNPPYDRPVLPPPSSVVSVARSSGISNTRVCLVNSMDADEGRTVYRDYFAYLKRKFENAGFQVTTVNGPAANVQFFRTGLKQFGVVIIFAHGNHDSRTGRSWLQTGEVGDPATFPPAVYLPELQSGQMDMNDVKEKRGGNVVETPYYSISDLFIQASYAQGDFPGTIMYLGACQILKDPNSRPFGQAFAAKGASAVIGWTELNSVGPSTSKRLFSFLLCGKTLQDAVRALPREDKSDRYASAILTYYPEAADNARLFPTERRSTLNIVRPKKDSVYTARTLNLEGGLAGSGAIDIGIAELNVVAVQLALESGRRSFLQQIGIKSGTNTLRITGSVDITNGCECVDSLYTFQGNFSPLDLWSELRWDTGTDVDFHLLRPGASFPGDLWTASDCYYSNKITSWGAFLDVDNTSGRGPEHITIPTASVSGVYRMFVHYYSARGVASTSAYVTVSAKNGPDQEFGPMNLTRSASRGGDVWEVCTIDLPSGTITRVMTKTTLPGSDGPGSRIHDKKK